MGKRIEATEGIPAIRFLRELDAALDKDPAFLSDEEGNHEDAISHGLEVRNWISACLDYINPDTCLSKSQAEKLEAEFASGLPFNFVSGSAEGVAAEVKSGLAEHRLPVLINSFRLDCENCLRENCSMRDPETSAEQVNKRLRSSPGLLKDMGPRELIETINIVPNQKRNLLAIFERLGIHSIDDIASIGLENLKKQDGFGKRSQLEFEALLKLHEFQQVALRSPKDALMMPIEYLGLGYSRTQFLIRRGVMTVRDLLDITEESFLDVEAPDLTGLSKRKAEISQEAYKDRLSYRRAEVEAIKHVLGSVGLSLKKG